MTRVAVIPGDGDFAGDVARAAAAGYTHVEIEGAVERPAGHVEALADAGLFVARVRLGGGLDDEDVERRRAVMGRMKRMAAEAARLGATTVSVTPAKTDAVGKAYFEEGRALLAAFAAARGVRVEVAE